MKVKDTKNAKKDGKNEIGQKNEIGYLKYYLSSFLPFSSSLPPIAILSQSFKIDLVLKKRNLVFNALTACYFYLGKTSEELCFKFSMKS
jgi:hypothetical protein